MALTVTTALGPATLARRDDGLDIGFETFATVIATVAALLVLGRFRTRGSLGDLVLGTSLAVLAGANLTFAVAPALAPDAPAALSTWAPLGARLLATAGVAVSPFLMDRRLADRAWPLAIAFALVATLLATIAGVAGALGARLPTGVAPDVGPDAFAWFRDAHGAFLAAQLATTLLFLVAAVGFARRAVRVDDEFVRWLGPAAIFAAIAYVNYSLFPSLYSPWVSIGDGFRVAAYFLVLVGASREVAVYQRERMEGAVLEERRRLARDLHDGLAQELALLVTQTRLLAMRNPSMRELDQIESTAQRALEESRLAIAALTRVGYEPLEVAVAAAAEEIAARAGVGVRLELAGGVDVPPDLKEAMVRIVREAVTNAVRHGHADEVTVELANEDGIRLAIVDQGAGFDPLANGGRSAGFGLTSMRERAEAVGGTLVVASEPGGGTRVEIAVP